MLSRNQMNSRGNYGRTSDRGKVQSTNEAFQSNKVAPVNYNRQYNTNMKSETPVRPFTNSSSSGSGFQSTLQKPTMNPATNSVGLMSLPSSSKNQIRDRPATSNHASRDSEMEGIATKMRKSGESDMEKLCILTGTVERVLKYGRIFTNHFCYFQVIGSVVSIADGKVTFEKTMLLRDKKGPVLQMIYYSNSTHINIEDFHLGQNLRAVGRMIGPNVMSAMKIRAASQEEMEILPRLCYVSDYAVSALCGDGQKQT